MPGAVGRTSTFALCNATLNWVIRLAEMGVDGAIQEQGPLREALDIYRGNVTNAAVAAAFDLPFEAI
jgi:alanine dehydrogenase